LSFYERNYATSYMMQACAEQPAIADGL
jgi:hypothetical protein